MYKCSHQLHARFLLDLADGTLAGILVMMKTATYCALTTGKFHLQLSRQHAAASLPCVVADDMHAPRAIETDST